MGRNSQSRSWDDILGLLFAGVGLLLLISLWSYHPSDPSLNSFGSDIKPLNLCGYWGAIFSDLLFQGFGGGSWVLVFVLFFQSYIFFTRQNEGLDRQLWLFGALGTLLFSCLFALHLGDKTFHQGHTQAGGFLGNMIVAFLLPVFNRVGLAIVLWLCAVAFLSLFSSHRMIEVLSYAGDWAKYMGAGFKESISKSVSFFRERLPRLPEFATEPKIFRRPKEVKEPGPRFFSLSSSEKEEEDFLEDEEESYDDSYDEDEIEEEDEEPTSKLNLSGYLTKKKKETSRRRLRPQMPRKVENWELPKISLLNDPPQGRTRLDEKELKLKSKLLVEKLAQFSVKGEVTGIKPGPAVTMFEFKPNADVKISKITDLADDLSLALSSESVRIVAPIPGRDVVGIETSNSQRETVFLKSIIQDDYFWDEEVKLPITLGRKADGEPRIVDLRKMPHLMVAGSTGSGKSVFVVSLITGLLLRHSPKTLRLVLVDPKQVDLAAINDIPHLVMPPIIDSKKAVGALRWGIREMEKRYRSMSKFGARGLEAFNDIVSELSKEQIDEHAAFHTELEGPYHPKSYYYEPLPYIVIVVEEFGDLMAVDKVNVEQAVVRLAQMARACGIHLVLAMQSPRKDVVTGLIKTNIPGRASFKVASKMDSRIILDESGAERLLARGDMLFLAPGVSKPERHHGPYLPEEEIQAVVEKWKEQGEPVYDQAAMKAVEGGGTTAPGEPSFDQDDEIKDDRYDEILEYVATQKEVSASLIQRRFRLGYPRAARMIELFESEGVVGPANGSKPRQVLIRELPR
ncbi:MAG TPA: cell division protein FtsK [Bdellovibrionales bacterium]|nr:cell division protein FtsK [Bdellovibrionales bacterium]